ncbi:MAG: hypothetical protein ABW328_11500 [Ilumatobacteraceae bacterium]
MLGRAIFCVVSDSRQSRTRESIDSGRANSEPYGVAATSSLHRHGLDDGEAAARYPKLIVPLPIDLAAIQRR